MGDKLNYPPKTREEYAARLKKRKKIAARGLLEPDVHSPHLSAYDDMMDVRRMRRLPSKRKAKRAL